MIAGAEPRGTTGAHEPWLVGALDLVLVWIERTKQRAQLATLEPHVLHDLGLSHADLDAECRKHFWQH